MPSVTPTFTVPKFQKTDTFQQEKPTIGGYFKTPTLNQDVFQPTATPPASSQVRSGLELSDLLVGIPLENQLHILHDMARRTPNTSRTAKILTTMEEIALQLFFQAAELNKDFYTSIAICYLNLVETLRLKDGNFIPLNPYFDKNLKTVEHQMVSFYSSTFEHNEETLPIQ